MDKTVEQRVKETIVETIGVDDPEVIPTASFVDDLGADSLDAVELLMALEEEFDIEIADEEVEKCVTVQDAIDLVKGKYKPPNQPSS